MRNGRDVFVNEGGKRNVSSDPLSPLHVYFVLFPQCMGLVQSVTMYKDRCMAVFYVCLSFITDRHQKVTAKINMVSG